MTDQRAIPAGRRDGAGSAPEQGVPGQGVPGQSVAGQAGPGQSVTGQAVPALGEIGLQNFAPYLMNRIMGRYNASLRDELAQRGLTTPKMRVLAVLSVIEGPTIGELAVYAVTEQSTLSRALDQLQADGLIRRETHEEDARATRIFATGMGREAFGTLWPHMADNYARMFRGIPEAERRAFVGTLQKILANIRRHEF